MDHMDICNFAYKTINLDGFSGNARDWQIKENLVWNSARRKVFTTKNQGGKMSWFKLLNQVRVQIAAMRKSFFKKNVIFPH